MILMILGTALGAWCFFGGAPLLVGYLGIALFVIGYLSRQQE